MSAKNLTNAAIEIINRFLSVYLDDGEPVRLRFVWKLLSALAGTMTLYAYSFSTSALTPSFLFSDWFFKTHNRQPWTNTTGDVIDFVINTILFGSPLMLAIAIASSIRYGGPLRFLLAGFFISVLMLSVLPTPDCPMPSGANTTAQ